MIHPAEGDKEQKLEGVHGWSQEQVAGYSGVRSGGGEEGERSER